MASLIQSLAVGLFGNGKTNSLPINLPGVTASPVNNGGGLTPVSVSSQPILTPANNGPVAQPIGIVLHNPNQGVGRQGQSGIIKAINNPGFIANPSGGPVGVISAPVATSPIDGQPLHSASQVFMTHNFTQNNETNQLS
jgi:hypothetical protein